MKKILLSLILVGSLSLSVFANSTQSIPYKNLKQKHKYLKKTFGQNVANLVKKNNNLKETNKQLNAEIVKLRNKIKSLQQKMAVDVQNVKE